MTAKTLLLALVLIASCARGQGSGTGLGIIVGEPTGLSGKSWIGDDRAVDFGLAWSLWRGRYLHLHSDYLFHTSDLINVSSGKFLLHYGPGLRLRSWADGRYWYRGQFYDEGGSRFGLGIRVPVGLTYLVEGAPVDIFIEVVPTMDLLPATYLDLDAGLGVRYYFN